ncbi:Hypothetical predicted protein [Mytilus galloprovincialis]|uniref:Reverse transcriptase domain-containing protein n=1 Tax=Mytilus galloprovincialis TaxID=29158 RepID=A0A8B6GV39_MYTGA|nr:Hypothetical predicted protein [Mytilus galloprovincialis]
MLQDDMVDRRTSLDEENKNLPDYDDRGINVLSEITVTLEDVKDIISTLDPNKAAGPDKISNRMLITVENEIALPLCIHTYMYALDNKFYTSLTFADVSKAFDRVWIRGLLLKLERYDIKGHLLIWPESYLTNKTQWVVLKEATSE